MMGFLVLILRIGMVVLLYSFVGWAIYTLYRDLRASALLTTGARIPALTLTWQEEGKSRQFKQAELTIGRDPGCDFPLNDDMVSARHARLSFHHNQWWVEDVRSTNGTFLNEERIYTPTVLMKGDELRCGKCHLEINLSEKNDGAG
jgi:pSer/pThr/pTyr-binding forkhead associated (FHA) protein